jgi:hypothetical protein
MIARVVGGGLDNVINIVEKMEDYVLHWKRILQGEQSQTMSFPMW